MTKHFLNLKAVGLVLGLSTFFIASSFAVQTRTMDENQRLEFRLSAHELNRLSIKGGLVATWTCGEGSVEEEVDETNGQLFLRPRIKEGMVYGTVTSDHGHIQDLAFRITKGAPESVILVPQDQIEPSSERHERSEGWTRLSVAPSSVHHSAVLLVSRLLSGEGRHASSKRVRRFEKGMFAPSMRCIRALKDHGLEAQLYIGSDKDHTPIDDVRAWKQQGDIAIGRYRHHLVVVRRAS